MDDEDKLQELMQSVTNEAQKIIKDIGEERFWEAYDYATDDPLKDWCRMMVEVFGTEEQKRRATVIRFGKLREYMEAREKEEE